MFISLHILHTEQAENWLVGGSTVYSNLTSLKLLKKCLKMYLSMEDWFHQTNKNEEVKRACPLISIVIQMIHESFPCTVGHGWQLQKSHGLTQMQTHMCLFGNGINFYGGPGECNHNFL